MMFVRENNWYVVKVEDGEDLFQCMEKFIREEKLASGVILMGIGMLRDFELGYFNGREYVKKRYEKPHELVSLKGTVAGYMLHLHAALANEKHEIIGGHLFSAKTCILNEIFIQRLMEISLNRIKNEKTGLMELVIRQQTPDK
ncbi:MAG: PPC domain-containing DNA-binding protein [Thermoplasmata archaeon]